MNCGSSVDFPSNLLELGARVQRIWRDRMWVLPQLLAFTPAGRPRLASPMAAFATTTPISAKLLMPPEAVSEVVSAMHSTTSTLAVVGPPGTELVFSFFEVVLLPYMAFACFIGWVSLSLSLSLTLSEAGLRR